MIGRCGLGDEDEDEEIEIEEEDWVESDRGEDVGVVIPKPSVLPCLLNCDLFDLLSETNEIELELTCASTSPISFIFTITPYLNLRPPTLNLTDNT